MVIRAGRLSDSRARGLSGSLLGRVSKGAPAMPNDAEALAIKLHEFFHAVEQGMGDGTQKVVGEPRRSIDPKERIVAAYKPCLEKLEEGERVTLACLIVKMLKP